MRTSFAVLLILFDQATQWDGNVIRDIPQAKTDEISAFSLLPGHQTSVLAP